MFKNTQYENNNTGNKILDNVKCDELKMLRITELKKMYAINTKIFKSNLNEFLLPTNKKNKIPIN